MILDVIIFIVDILKTSEIVRGVIKQIADNVDTIEAEINVKPYVQIGYDFEDCDGVKEKKDCVHHVENVHKLLYLMVEPLV